MGCIFKLIVSAVIGVMAGAFGAFVYLLVCAIIAVSVGESPYTIEALRTCSIISGSVIGVLAFLS